MSFTPFTEDSFTYELGTTGIPAHSVVRFRGSVDTSPRSLANFINDLLSPNDHGNFTGPVVYVTDNDRLHHDVLALKNRGLKYNSLLIFADEAGPDLMEYIQDNHVACIIYAGAVCLPYPSYDILNHADTLLKALESVEAVVLTEDVCSDEPRLSDVVALCENAEQPYTTATTSGESGTGPDDEPHLLNEFEQLACDTVSRFISSLLQKDTSSDLTSMSDEGSCCKRSSGRRCSSGKDSPSNEPILGVEDYLPF